MTRHDTRLGWSDENGGGGARGHDEARVSRVVGGKEIFLIVPLFMLGDHLVRFAVSQGPDLDVRNFLASNTLHASFHVHTKPYLGLHLRCEFDQSTLPKKIMMEFKFGCYELKW
jgi:hypothetical protein